MKRIVFAVLAALVLLVSGVGCAQPGREVVNVYNWGEYIDESLLRDFERQTGIRVNYQTFATNEEMYANLRLGGADYDVIIPSDYMISRLIDEDMLEKPDFSNIPNYSMVGGEFKNREHDPTGEYSVAYMWGTIVLIYNSTMVDEDIDSWGAMFDERYAGNIVMVDNPRDAFGIALKYLGYSLNTTDDAELLEAFDLLMSQSPLLKGWVTDTIFDVMEGGNAAIGVYYAGDFITMRDSNPDLRAVLPLEGSNVFIDAMCIPKGAANKTNAEKFINFMTSTEAALRNMEAIGYVSSNTEAAEIFRGELDEEDLFMLFPDEEILARCEVFKNLPRATLERYDELWRMLRI